MILQPLVNQQLGQNMIHLHPDRAHLPFINIKIWLPTTRFGYLQLASVTFNLLLHLLHFLVTVQFHSLDSPVDLVFDRSLIFAEQILLVKPRGRHHRRRRGRHHRRGGGHHTGLSLIHLVPTILSFEWPHAPWT